MRWLAAIAAAGLAVLAVAVLAATSAPPSTSEPLADRLRHQLQRERDAHRVQIRAMGHELHRLRKIAAPIISPSPAGNRQLARAYFGPDYPCAAQIISGETGGTWRHDVAYGFRYGEGLIDSGLAYGLPQARPGSKMRSVAGDAASNPLTQLVWMAKYARERYGGICAASAHWSAVGNW